VIKFTHACGKDNPMGYWSEPVTGPGWLDPAQPVPPPKKESGPGPADQIICFAKHTLMLCPYILFPFQYQKIPKIFGQLSWFICEPLKFHFIFFPFVSFFYAICSICRPLLLNVNMLCNVFFSKKTNNKKGKQKEKGIKKLFFLH
jgi:hypothetical protein